MKDAQKIRSLERQNADLREQLETREEELAQLKEASSEPDWIPIQELKLTPTEEKCCRALLRRDRVAISQLCALLETTLVTLRVHISRIRLKLEPHGIEIANYYGFGYCLVGDGRKALKKLSYQPLSEDSSNG